jgi:hypothetical protein
MVLFAILQYSIALSAVTEAETFVFRLGAMTHSARESRLRAMHDSAELFNNIIIVHCEHKKVQTIEKKML